MFSSLLFVGVLTMAPRHHHRQPKWLDGELAKRSVGADIAAYDPRSGFMLVGGGDCDGAFLGSTLTADRYEIAKRGYEVPKFNPQYGAENGHEPMLLRKLPLSTGNGIRIGDTEERLLSRFGKPQSIHAAGWRKQFRVYEYSWHDRHKSTSGGETFEDGRSYDQEYTFKRGKLIEIHYGSASDMSG